MERVHPIHRRHGPFGYSRYLDGTPLRSVTLFTDGTQWRYLGFGWWWRCRVS